MILRVAAAIFGLILLAAACIRRPDPRRDDRDEGAEFLGLGTAETFTSFHAAEQ